MHLFWDNLPWLITMVFLIAFSAFFSASEAALFSLRGPDRRMMSVGTTAERLAERLLRNPDRLLSAVLFWNLLVNLLYFAIATMIGTRWGGHSSLSILFAVGSLIAIIFFSEMLPKSVGVLSARSASTLVGVPMTMAVRLVDPIMPALRTVNLLSRRLIWPGLEERPHLESSDLERAIELSQSNSEKDREEKVLLHNIVQLSDLQAQEWMRPRNVISSFRPPVSLDDLRDREIRSGYLLVTDEDGDEIAKSLDLYELSSGGQQRLDLLARPVSFVPWCASIGDVLETLQRETAQVASVVNERGETVGIITIRDIFDAVLTENPQRGERLLNRSPIVELGPGEWQVDGMTNVRRLSQLVDIELPHSRNVTLGGVVQETLEHLPKLGDTCEWGPFSIEVRSLGEDADLQLAVKLRESGEGDG